MMLRIKSTDESDAMRTTLAIDDDVLAAAKHLAEREHRSIGEVISALARQGLSRGTRSNKTERNGIPLLPSRKAAVPVTLELVNQLRDEQP
jgi:Ribbon-helix-helix protein, copG family